MSAMTKILTGAAGLAAVAGFASPAAAQYYPQNNGGVLGAIIGAIGGGYGQYPYGNYGYGQTNDRYAVDQCARVVEARLNGNGYNNGYGGYGNYGTYGGGYGAYGNSYGGGRVTGITRVERRSGGGLKVYGVAQTNAYAGYNNGYGYNQGYGYSNQGYGAGYPDIKFNCKVNTRGQITDVDIDRMRTYNRNDYYYGYRR